MTFFSSALLLIAAVRHDVEEGKHDSNPEATLSTFGLPSVFDLFELVPFFFFFFCLRACCFFNDLLCSVVDEMRNEEMQEEFE